MDGGDVAGGYDIFGKAVMRARSTVAVRRAAAPLDARRKRETAYRNNNNSFTGPDSRCTVHEML